MKKVTYKKNCRHNMNIYNKELFISMNLFQSPSDFANDGSHFSHDGKSVGWVMSGFYKFKETLY